MINRRDFLKEIIYLLSGWFFLPKNIELMAEPLSKTDNSKPTHLNVPTKYWELTKEAPPPPIERDIKSWITENPADALWDIDTLPLTYTDSRWSAFILRVAEESRRRLCPDPPLRIWDGENADLVEFWYSDHKNTMLGPHFEFGVTIPVTLKDDK